jgi:hypothetical protein
MEEILVDEKGSKFWLKDGRPHRSDGPAVEQPDGIETKYWYWEGEFLGLDDHGFWALWDRLTDEQRNNLNLLMHLPKAGE